MSQVPAPITTHVVDAGALLTSLFRKKRNVPRFLAAFIRQIQVFENAAQVVLQARTLDSSIGGVVYDLLGALIGEPRDGRADGEYKLALRVRVAINRSTARASEIAKILASAAPTTLEFGVAYPAGFHALLAAPTAAEFSQFVDIVAEVAPLGVDAQVLWGSSASTMVRPKWSSAGATRARGPGWSSPGAALAFFAYTVGVP